MKPTSEPIPSYMEDATSWIIKPGQNPEFSLLSFEQACHRILNGDGMKLSIKPTHFIVGRVKTTDNGEPDGRIPPP